MLTNFLCDFPVLGLMNIGVAFFRLLATERRDDVNGCFYTVICCKSNKIYLLKHFFLRWMRYTTFRYYLGLLGRFFKMMFLSLVYRHFSRYSFDNLLLFKEVLLMSASEDFFMVYSVLHCCLGLVYLRTVTVLWAEWPRILGLTFYSQQFL
jgi:hypothetical protein